MPIFTMGFKDKMVGSLNATIIDLIDYVSTVLDKGNFIFVVLEDLCKTFDVETLTFNLIVLTQQV